MTEGNSFVKDLTKMEEDFAKWYTDIVLKAELVDYSEAKGFVVIRPYGYALWENIRDIFDKKFKETGHKNAYFPLLIPESLLNKEKEHVEGFAPEVAWVTHGGNEKLEERFCIRPTSETIICSTYAKWIHSYRDLPLLINQWANVVRWEKTTRPFLRTREFLWQEGHTLHSTEQEAREETLRMIHIYEKVCFDYLAMPVLVGRKSDKEKFAGAVETYTIEAMMHDGKALQSGTSHYLGQGFADAFDIKFQNKEGKMETCYQTSWGISTRLIGGIIMTHGDDRGLRLPPKVAPTQVVIVPVAQHKDGVLDKVYEISNVLKDKYRVHVDDREEYSPGYKFNYWELRGVPVRVEIGPRDIENNQCVIVRRDTFEKIVVCLDELDGVLNNTLNLIQDNMLKQAMENRKNKTYKVDTLDEYIELLKEKQGFVKLMWCGDRACEEELKEKTGGITIRCMPFEQEHFGTKCFCCGKEAKHMIYTGNQY